MITGVLLAVLPDLKLLTRFKGIETLSCYNSRDNSHSYLKLLTRFKGIETNFEFPYYPFMG